MNYESINEFKKNNNQWIINQWKNKNKWIINQ